MARRILHPENLIALTIAPNLMAQWRDHKETPKEIREILARSVGGTRVSIASAEERKALYADAKRMRTARANGECGTRSGTKGWDSFLTHFGEVASANAVRAAAAEAKRKAAQRERQEREAKQQRKQTAKAQTARRRQQREANAATDAEGHANFVAARAAGQPLAVEIDNE